MLLDKLFKNPPLWIIITACALTLVFTALSITVLVLNIVGIVAYLIYAFSALFLGYTAYTVVRFLPKLKEALKKSIKKNPITERYVHDFGYRALIGSFFSLIISIAFGIFNGAMGIISSSFWYGSLSLYYIMLSLIYGSIALNRKTDSSLSAYKIYRRCGWLLAILNTSLSISIAQMIFENRGFEYAGLMIYAYAAFAFYKIIMAVIQLFKAKHHDSPLVKATAFINLIGGMVSILALQTALLSTFADASADPSAFNTITGSAVSVISVFISVFMIVKGTKNIKLERKNERK